MDSRSCQKVHFPERAAALQPPELKTIVTIQKPSSRPADRSAAAQNAGGGFSPVKFLAEVRTEARRVTWPSRRATLVTTGAVLAMAALTSVFFFVVDQVIGLGVRELFGVGG
jgi:preprotein translocase subunit SecE